MKRVGLLVGAATLTLTGGSFADTDTAAQNDELKARIAELESRLATVETQENETWLTEQRADEIRGLVTDVLADADTRASLLAQGMTAGYDDGAVIASADGNWLLRTNLHMQQRFVMNFMDSSPLITDDDRGSFENTRTKFILSGNVVSPDWFYRVDINVATASISSGIDLNGDGYDDLTGTSRDGLLNAYLGYDYGNGFKIMMGSMKAPGLREEMVDSRYQLLVERSLVNYIFSPGYVDGLALDYQGDQFGVAFSYDDGGRTGGTPWSVADTDFAFHSRVAFLAMGTWDQFTDLTSPRGEENGLLIGGSFSWESGESDTPLDDLDIFLISGDVSWEFGGGNILFALMYRNVDTGALLPDQDQLGIVVQGGYYLNDTWELFGRWEWADMDTDPFEDVNIFTIGVNKYFADHHAKWTTDVSIGFDGILGIDAAAGDALDVSGYRVDAAGNDGQVAIRTQIQIIF
ncbi:MAG: porin [Planctomycetota bacterium]|jgi:hypothetical protein